MGRGILRSKRTIKRFLEAHGHPVGSHRRISGPDDPDNPSLEDQVTAGINYVIYQQEAQIRARFVLMFRPRWIAEWANRKQMAIPMVVGF